MLVGLTVLVALDDWGWHGALPVICAAVICIGGLLALRVKKAHLLFVAAAVAVTGLLVLTTPGWQDILLRALRSAAFIGALFTALTTLRNVAETSPSIRRVGTFLATQPPGRRYIALTLGGHLFALLLNYGSVSILGSLAKTSTASEPDEEVRRIRLRRMLVAVQRGLVSALAWSPLGFAMAVSTSVVPGATWAGAAVPGVVISAILLLMGWAIDTAFKPRLSRTRPPMTAPAGSWWTLWPLWCLLATLGVIVFAVHLLTGVDIIGIVMVVVPLLSLGWAVIQQRGGDPQNALGPRLSRYLRVELPANSGQVLLLMMAGYIGTTGGPILGPFILGLGIDPMMLPPWGVLLSIMVILPILGQLGMNPILGVTLCAQLLPTPAELGVSPNAIAAAILSAWTLSGITSPFTATTLIVGQLAEVSAIRAGLIWNWLYLVLTGGILAGWVLLYAFVIAA